MTQKESTLHLIWQHQHTSKRQALSLFKQSPAPCCYTDGMMWHELLDSSYIAGSVRDITDLSRHEVQPGCTCGCMYQEQRWSAPQQQVKGKGV